MSSNDNDNQSIVDEKNKHLQAQRLGLVYIQSKYINVHSHIIYTIIMITRKTTKSNLSTETLPFL